MVNFKCLKILSNFPICFYLKISPKDISPNLVTLDAALFSSDFSDQTWKQGCQMGYMHTQNTSFWFIFEGIGMENYGTFYVWPFLVFYGHLDFCMAIWYVVPR
jgi:hypothetical protein